MCSSDMANASLPYLVDLYDTGQRRILDVHTLSVTRKILRSSSQRRFGKHVGYEDEQSDDGESVMFMSSRRSMSRNAPTPKHASTRQKETTTVRKWRVYHPLSKCGPLQ